MFLSAPYLAQAQQMSMTSVAVVPATLAIMPVFYYRAPAFLIFQVSNPSATESIDFGDGRTTGTQGCTKNQLGWCDLSGLIFHRYDFPGRYTVSLYAHYTPKTYQLLSTTTVTILP
jgi:hypothetical protein